MLNLWVENFSTYKLLLNLSEVRVTSINIEETKIISCFVKNTISEYPYPNHGKLTTKVNQKTLHRVRNLDILD